MYVFFRFTRLRVILFVRNDFWTLWPQIPSISCPSPLSILYLRSRTKMATISRSTITYNSLTTPVRHCFSARMIYTAERYRKWPLFGGTTTLRLSHRLRTVYKYRARFDTGKYNDRVILIVHRRCVYAPTYKLPTVLGVKIVWFMYSLSTWGEREREGERRMDGKRFNHGRVEVKRVVVAIQTGYGSRKVWLRCTLGNLRS